VPPLTLIVSPWVIAGKLAAEITKIIGILGDLLLESSDNFVDLRIVAERAHFLDLMTVFLDALLKIKFVNF
jgi:hypothetical protein